MIVEEAWKQKGIDMIQPDWVCHDCGVKYGNKQYENHISTWHNGTCGVCNQEKPVTEPRDFGYLTIT